MTTVKFGSEVSLVEMAVSEGSASPVPVVFTVGVVIAESEVAPAELEGEADVDEEVAEAETLVIERDALTSSGSRTTCLRISSTGKPRGASSKGRSDMMYM